MSDSPHTAAEAFARLRAVMAITDTTGPEKAVLLVLAIMANTSGEAWPAVRGDRGLMAKCSLGERTIVRALRALESAGHIGTRHIPGKGSIYTVHPCHSGTPATAAPLPQRQGGLPEGQGTPATAAAKQPPTAIQKKTSSSPKARAAKISFDVPDGVPADAWRGWLEMRRAIGKALDTQHSYSLAVNKLKAFAEAGQPPGEILDQSTFNKWPGLFPLKDNHHGKSGGSGVARPGRDRQPDGFMSALREVPARHGSDDLG